MMSKVLVFSLFVLAASAFSIQEDAEVNAEKVKFFLYNQASQFGTAKSGKELIIASDSTFQNTGIASSEKLIILIHGFLQNHECGFPQDVKDTYLNQNQNINVITVDYASIACHGMSEALSPLCYPSAVNGIGTVGQKIADLLAVLKSKGLINPANVRLVGVSLGAHVAGHAASKYSAANGGQKLGRITALDPAGPLFTCSSGARCLNKDDATFVDVIHSDMGNLGNTRAMGDIDFYPNGGQHPQPTCDGQSSSCSHAAAAKYFMKSIGVSNIHGYKCTSYAHLSSGDCKSDSVVFGDNAKAGATGNHYLHIDPIDFSGRYTCY